ncbi:MAG: UPF0158 family protein [Adhaeribacter sp.]
MVTAKQINEIVQDLDCGFRCFIHKESGVIRVIPDERQISGFDGEGWEEDQQELTDNEEQYLEVEKMPSPEEFQVMEDFTRQVAHDTLRRRLTDILRGPKPFRKFKEQVQAAGDYREEWFAFRDARQVEWVTRQLRHLSDGPDQSDGTDQ